MSDQTTGRADPPAENPEPPEEPPSIPSLLGSLVLGTAALGWVALWFVDRGECVRDGVVLVCDNGSLTTEINLVASAGLVLFGVLAILRGLLGLGLRVVNRGSAGTTTPPTAGAVFPQPPPPPVEQRSIQPPPPVEQPPPPTPVAHQPPPPREVRPPVPVGDAPAPPGVSGQPLD